MVGSFFILPRTITILSPPQASPSHRSPTTLRPSPLERDVGRFVCVQRREPGWSSSRTQAVRGLHGVSRNRPRFSSWPVFSLPFSIFHTYHPSGPRHNSESRNDCYNHGTTNADKGSPLGEPREEHDPNHDLTTGL
jgi:hypothetical protein